MDFHETSQALDDNDSDALAVEIARLTETINAGKQAEQARADLFRRAHGRDPKRWTQTWLAQQAGISQAAVSKLLRTPGEQNLQEATDPAYLVGRLLGLANRMAVSRVDSSAGTLERMTDKLVEEKLAITPQTLRELHRQIEGNLRRVYYRKTFTRILADIDDRLPEYPTLPNDHRTRVQLLLGFDHQRAAINQIMRETDREDEDA